MRGGRDTRGLNVAALAASLAHLPARRSAQPSQSDGTPPPRAVAKASASFLSTSRRTRRGRRHLGSDGWEIPSPWRVRTRRTVPSSFTSIQLWPTDLLLPSRHCCLVQWSELRSAHQSHWYSAENPLSG